MQLRLRAVGTRQPAWIQQGFNDYAKRLPRHCGLLLEEVELPPRRKGGVPERLRDLECQRLLGGIQADIPVIALDERGDLWRTDDLASRLMAWLEDGRDRVFLIGGPDGLASTCWARAVERWSLSPLTLPHGLVRLVVAEQLYRAWSMLSNHPYHRAG